MARMVKAGRPLAQVKGCLSGIQPLVTDCARDGESRRLRRRPGLVHTDAWPPATEVIESRDH